MKITHRWVRLRLIWLLILPFLYFARPTPTSLVVGSLLAILGATVRGWAAGTLRKNRALATSGPYAFTRNPLYLGSFLIGMGVTVAGNVLVFVLLFTVFYLIVYVRVARREARFLAEKFGESYRRYAAQVPLFLPRPIPFRASSGGAERFDFAQYRRNKEYEALLGLMAGFAFLTAKMILFG